MECELPLNKIKHAVNFLCEIAGECRFNISKDGINVNLVDAANVCLVSLTIPNTAFDWYTCTESSQVGIELNKLKHGMTKAHRFGSKACIKITEKHISFSCCSYGFKNGLLDADKVRAEPRTSSYVDMEFSNDFTISSNNLKNAFDVMDSIKYATIVSDNGDIGIYQEYNEDRTDITFGTEITINKSADASSLLSLDYLNDVLPKIKHMCNTVCVEFDKDWPIKISSVDNDIKFMYLQAPRIESD